MVMLGTFQAIEGLVALFKDTYFVTPRSGLVVSVSYTTWGWVHLLLGILVALAGLGVMAGQGWARWFAIVVVSLNFIAQLGFLGNSQYPLWSLTVMALNVIILFALTARWSESTSDLQAAR